MTDQIMKLITNISDEAKSIRQANGINLANISDRVSYFNRLTLSLLENRTHKLSDVDLKNLQGNLIDILNIEYSSKGRRPLTRSKIASDIKSNNNLLNRTIKSIEKIRHKFPSLNNDELLRSVSMLLQNNIIKDTKLFVKLSAYDFEIFHIINCYNHLYDLFMATGKKISNNQIFDLIISTMRLIHKIDKKSRIDSLKKLLQLHKKEQLQIAKWQDEEMEFRQSYYQS